VLTTIDFDNQFSFQADKVDDVLTDNVLTAKFVTAQLTCTQMAPERAFGIRGIST